MEADTVVCHVVWDMKSIKDKWTSSVPWGKELVVCQGYETCSVSENKGHVVCQGIRDLYCMGPVVCQGIKGIKCLRG